MCEAPATFVRSPLFYLRRQLQNRDYRTQLGCQEAQMKRPSGEIEGCGGSYFWMLLWDVKIKENATLNK